MVKPTNNGTLITLNNVTNIDDGKLYKIIVR